MAQQSSTQNGKINDDQTKETLKYLKKKINKKQLQPNK